MNIRFCEKKTAVFLFIVLILIGCSTIGTSYRITKKTVKAVRKENGIGVKKQYLKTGNACSVTFRLPQEAAPDATVITVVGEFNNWSITETPMKKLKNGSFSATVKLTCDNEYRFRYLIDSNRWENDWCADEYKRNAFGGEDSVIKI